MVLLTINEQGVETREGTTILEVAKAMDIEIPTLCYHPSLSPYGACRICLVEIVKGGRPGLVTACTYPVQDGLVIRTDTERVIRARKIILELLLARSPSSPKLNQLAVQMGIKWTRFKEKRDECILCGLCSRLCQEKIGASRISFVHRGSERRIAIPFDQYSEECRECQACAGICPIGAVKYQDDEDRIAPVWFYRLGNCQAIGERPKAVVDQDRCSGDQLCMAVCPVGAISMAEYSSREPYQLVARVNQGLCISCGYCTQVCTKGAIYIPESVLVEEEATR